MGNTSRLCLICGQVSGSDAERHEHIKAEHTGTRVEWRDRRPYVVSGDTATRIGAAALKRMRRNALAVTGGQAATRGRAVLARPPDRPVADPPVMVEKPLPDDPDAPPYYVQAQPLHLTPSGPVDTGDISSPAVSAQVSRETIRLALDQPTLAGMIRNLSIVASDWDGAGAAGHLSAIEAGQLAMLLHDPTVVAIERFFGGNVDRFKLALAAGILLLGKGRVHIRAIIARRATAEEQEVVSDIDAAYLATQPRVPIEVPAPATPIDELAARQREWNTTPRENVS